MKTSLIPLMVLGLLSADVAQGQVQCDEVGNVADFNADHRVSLEDFVILAKYWLDGCSGPNWCEESDLDNSGIVDANDFTHFSSNWLWPHLIQWLKDQQDLHTTGLVESYQNDGRTNAYIYDQALAIIAFTEAGYTIRARSILDSMVSLQREDPDGAWYLAYRAEVADPEWPPGDSYFYRTGPIAWMVVATNFYECRTGDPNYAPMARRALGWLDRMRNIDPNDETYGSLCFRCSASNPGYTCDISHWISTEHNHDAYSAYYWRGVLDSNDSYLEKASLILSFLRQEMWAPSETSNSTHDVDIFWRGYNDCVVATDCQSWGALSLGQTEPNGEEFYKSLDWLWDSDDSPRNQHDYCNEPNVDGFKSYIGSWDICDPNTWSWNIGEPPRIWVEATEGVAAAFYSSGGEARGDHFHNQMGRIICRSGGLIHSFSETHPDSYQGYMFQSVASTAWYYFNERKINPFNPDSCAAK